MTPVVQVLDNAMLWIGDGTAYPGHLVISDGKIQTVATGPYTGPLPKIDLAGLSLSPGMIDLMVLGAFDLSILRDDPLDIARQYLRLGVTSCQLCSGTLPWPSFQQVVDNTRRCMTHSSADAAKVLGYYMEGPFQQPELTGASLRQYALPPTKENVQRVLDLGSPVTMVNVSPGIEGDAQAVRMLKSAGKVVSMAHSNAPAHRVLACIDAGTSVLGHVWDNNAALLGDSNVQQPTLEHVTLTDERIKFIHLICDGTHVHPIMVRLTLRCRGVQSICLVTDAVPGAGCPDGPYTWDDGRVFYKKDGVGRTDTGWLNGSALLLPDHFRNFIKFTGLQPHQAIRAVTLNPAASLGLDSQIGLLAPGRVADLLAWDDRITVKRIWRAGQEITNVSDYAEIQI